MAQKTAVCPRRPCSLADLDSIRTRSRVRSARPLQDIAWDPAAVVLDFGGQGAVRRRGRPSSSDTPPREGICWTSPGIPERRTSRFAVPSRRSVPPPIFAGPGRRSPSFRFHDSQPGAGERAGRSSATTRGIRQSRQHCFSDIAPAALTTRTTVSRSLRRSRPRRMDSATRPKRYGQSDHTRPCRMDSRCPAKSCPRRTVSPSPPTDAE